MIYLVLDPGTVDGKLSPQQIRLICDRHYGVGSDGILLTPLPSDVCDFGLRLFNPDGGEFEKSGNGLRIFARYLWDEGRVSRQSFTIETPGGVVSVEVRGQGHTVTVDMGHVSFSSSDSPVAGQPRDVVGTETITVDDRTFASVPPPSAIPIALSCAINHARLAQRYGPTIDTIRVSLTAPTSSSCRS